MKKGLGKEDYDKNDAILELHDRIHQNHD